MSELKCGKEGCNNPTTEVLKILVDGKEIPACSTCWNKSRSNLVKDDMKGGENDKRKN